MFELCNEYVLAIGVLYHEPKHFEFSTFKTQIIKVKKFKDKKQCDIINK